MTTDVRATLGQMIAEAGIGYSDISRLIGRNAAYIQQFIRRGTPRKLDENDRRIIAAYFGVSEVMLLGHTKIESTVRYLGVDVEDALTLAEGAEI